MENKKKDPGLDNSTIQHDGQNALEMGKNYLLCIGIDKYVHCQPLNNAVKDANDFQRLLLERYQFEQENCTIIVNEEATKKKIDAAFRDMIAKVTSNDNLIVYFSGHGEFDRTFTQQGYWIPVEAERGDYTDYLPNSTIRDLLDVIKSRHTFLIADSCFAGTLFSSKDVRNIADRREIDPSRWGLTAGRNEIVDDGPPGTNSPFAKKLLDELRKNDKPLGVAELCAKIMEIVQANANQTPRGEPLKIKGHDGGQFFFHLRNFEAIESQRIAQAEKDAFESAKRDGSVQALTRYVLDCADDSPYKEEAKRLLAEAEEESAWKDAKRKNTLTAYLHFKDLYGEGRYADNCEERIDRFRQPVPPKEDPKPIYVVPPPTPKPAPAPTPTPTVVVPVSEPSPKAPKPSLVPTTKQSFTLPFNKWWLVAAALLIVAVMVGLNMANNKKTAEPPVVTVTDEAAYNKAEQENTIRAWESFIAQYPSSGKLQSAWTNLNNRKEALNRHLKNAKSQIYDFPEDAKHDLEAASSIDPDNAEVKQLLQRLK